MTEAESNQRTNRSKCSSPQREVPHALAQHLHLPSLPERVVLNTLISADRMEQPETAARFSHAIHHLGSAIGRPRDDSSGTTTGSKIRSPSARRRGCRVHTLRGLEQLPIGRKRELSHSPSGPGCGRRCAWEGMSGLRWMFNLILVFWLKKLCDVEGLVAHAPDRALLLWRVPALPR